MIPDRGVYGPDDVPWETQAARDAELEVMYRKHREGMDNRARLDAKMSLLYAHEEDGKIYQDSDNQLRIGYERNGAIYTFALLNIEAAFIHFTPLEKTDRVLVVWGPLSQIKLTTFRYVAPKGCI